MLLFVSGDLQVERSSIPTHYLLDSPPPESKKAEMWVQQLNSPSAKVKNASSCTSTSPSTFTEHHTDNFTVSVKIKVTLEKATKAQRVCRGVALIYIFKLGATCWWVVNATPRPLYALRNIRYPLYRRLGGAQGRSGLVRKISPPPGFDPRTVQPVACRFTDSATPAAG